MPVIKKELMNTILTQTIEELHSLQDLNLQQFVKKMIPSEKVVIGIRTPLLKKIIKNLRNETSDFSIREKIELAIGFIHTNIFEMGQIGYEFAGKDKAILSQITKEDLIQMNYRLDNWASVDIFAVYVHGKAWRSGVITDDDLIQLAQHKNFWQRRLAVVSTIPLNQKSNGGTGDPHRTLMICNLVLTDYEDLVVKALSWALRELSKREPELIHNYLENHRQILHKRVIREVNNKLTFGVKNLR